MLGRAGEQWEPGFRSGGMCERGPGYLLTQPVDAHVRLSVFDATGREVKVLVDEGCSARADEAVPEARDLPSGVYVYRITAGTYRAARKLVLLK